MNRTEKSILQLNLEKKWIKSYQENDNIIIIMINDNTICRVASNTSKYRVLATTDNADISVIISKVNPFPINNASLVENLNDDNFKIVIAKEKQRLLTNYQNSCRLGDESLRQKTFSEYSAFLKLV